MERESLRKGLIFSLVFFCFYFLLGSVFSYFINTSNLYNVFFGADSPRILIDLVQVAGGHYRTIVHPLFVIFFQPLVHILNFVINNGLLASLLLQSLVSAISLCFLYLTLDKLKLDNKIKVMLLIIMSVSFAQIVFNSTLETYAFAQLFLIILFYYALGKDNHYIKDLDVIILIILGIMNLGVTITNYFVYLIVLFYFLFTNKKENMRKKITLALLIIFLSVTISIALSEIQAVFFDGSSLFFKENIYNFLFGSSEELTYIESFSFNSIINQIKSFFVYGFFAPKLYLTNDVYNMRLAFGEMYFVQKIFILISLLIFLAILGMFIKRNYKNIFQHKYLILLIIAFMFNFVLHVFYGNSEAFLYILHYQFLFILIIAYLLQSFSDKNIKYIKLFLVIFIIVEIMFNAVGVFNMFTLCKNNFGILKNDFTLIIIACVLCMVSLILLFRIKLKNKICILAFLIFIIVSLLFGYNTFIKKSFRYDEYTKTYDVYIKQLKLLEKEFDVEVAFENKDDDFFFFGMGNRKKLMYQNGNLYDLENEKLIVSYDVKKEMIVPNEYIVVLKTKENKIVKIYEDENGIFIKEIEKLINLDENAVKINLPEFEDSKYSEVLKVLHQEILFNIDESVIKPNILVYSNAWYRDGMLGAMVLDKTNNVNLIKTWVDSIDEIYDKQNGTEEADNLGELLYLLHITDSQNKIKKNVINEINNIKESNNNYITGYTDGQILSYYPTAVAKYAASKSGIDLDLSLPDLDNYASLTWFYNKNRDFTNVYDSIDYPYLGWASYHSSGKGGLYICDDIYPLSYERQATYANYSSLPEYLNYYKNVALSPTHVWDAAEKFLFLIEQN